MSKIIHLARPDLSRLERAYIDQALDSLVLSLGPWIERFESAMKERCGTRHAIAVSSGTAGLHLLVRALGLKAGDKVATTPFSFVASSNCLLYEGVEPVFVDVDPDTWNMDINRVGELTGLHGILAVDVFGLTADWSAIRQLASERHLRVIADSCESLGATTPTGNAGALGDGSVFGFYPNKQITTGEGGCVTTNDDRVAEEIRSTRNHGRDTAGTMKHVRLGFNYRMNELSAALGTAQLERLDGLLARRSEVAATYMSALAEFEEDLHLPPDAAGRSWFVFVPRLADHFAPGARDELMVALRELDIQCAPYFPAIHLQPYYRKRFGFKRGDFPICERISDRTIAIPFHTQLSDGEIDRVVNGIKNTLPKLRRTKSVMAT